MPSISSSPEDRQPAAGVLYVVATPIGHLDDITVRALAILGAVDLIAAEDTRHTRKLLTRHGITAAKLTAYHEHNEQRKAPRLIEMMQQGAALALVSDAGTPLISDPGYRLVRSAGRCGLPVIPIPGPNACGAALSVSGLPTDQFLFVGFPPRKTGARQKLLRELKGEGRTLVFYESPHRICTLLEELSALWGERQVLCAREMTKLHEEYLRGALADVARQLAGRERVRGEITLVVAGNPVPAGDGPGELEDLLSARLAEPGASLSRVVKDVARDLSLSRKRVYQTALKIQEKL